ncbi:MAG: hypothetical protein QOF30_2870 [Acidimicrobiaceae bacterium]|nr:hypothetical protein [Acidimicrobiaceae bacterium]
MVRRLAVFFAVSIMTVAFASAVPAGALVPNPNQSLNCNSSVSTGQVHCTATDNGGIARIRVTDKQTGAVVKVLHFSCTAPTTDRVGFSYPSNSDPTRVQILDCKGNTSSYNVPEPS